MESLGLAGLGQLQSPQGVPMNTVTPVSTAQVVSLAGSSKVMAEYIWLGQSGADLKSRTVVLDELPSCADDLPIAEIDGSSYGQAAEESCEIYLQPKKIFADPFRGGNHILVLCDTYVPPLMCTTDPWDDMQPHISNHRAACEQVLKQAAHHQPVFTMQQEYTLTSDWCAGDGGFMMGSAPMPIKNAPGLSEKATARMGREVSELHMRACLSAGLSYSGSTVSSTHQYSYKIGPCLGVNMADQISMSRFLLHRVAEHSQAGIHYDTTSKAGGHSSGNKCILQFSTATSRDPISGLSAVQDMMERLHTNHVQHLANYGGGGTAAAGNGSQQSAGSWHSASGAFSEHHQQQQPGSSHGNTRFTVGVGNKHASIMVPTSTLLNKCGPILDRRPPASTDPYLAIMLLVSSACGIQLPQATMSAMQLAAALTRSPPPMAMQQSPRVEIPSSHRHSHSVASFGSDGCGSAAPSCICSDLSGSADSQDVLLSALDKLDGFSPTTPLMMAAGSMGGYGSDAGSDLCSDASSPPYASQSLAGAVKDEEMFYE